ncbi:hypothetical protein BDP27DRAFT_1310729 [Rhodocollybia butyracea]|uniref:BRCT domain-containing protein n=1 Tax=Rhodocollybia butyracea TaxID=206335 RepID=A0A9P5QAK1_9AGAR|nr:hypothetical protein BDP27DRAFT_1310729 [Rhodocollybia butyracea]
MGRRNKSAKVPGVKLRPAQPGASSKIYVENDDTVRVQDSQFAGDDTGYFDPVPRPFNGVLLCATGLSDKLVLFKQAVELGAMTTHDLTDRVTHLIAKQHGGAKYQVALENKIPILQPSWVTESYYVWLHGDDVDLEQSIAQHRLPIFSDIILCISGIPDILRRTEISRIVMTQGGQYVKDLNRPVRVTHLLCSGDKETDKMHYAEKFNKQGEADIKLVWEEWFWDSLEFGGRFDESKYQARQPRPKLRKTLAPSETRVRPQAKPHNVADEQDDDEPVQASVRKPVGFQRELWRSVLAPRGYTWNEEETALVKSPTKALRARFADEDGETEQEDASILGKGRNSGSVLSSVSFRRANSFAQLPSKQKQPLRRLLSTRLKALSQNPNSNGDDDDDMNSLDMEQGGNLGMEVDTPGAGPSNHHNAVGNQSTTSPRASTPSPAPLLPDKPSIFDGLKIAALGEANCQSVKSAVQKAGGTFVEDIESGDLESGADGVDIVIVRLVSGSKTFASLSLSPHVREKFRTECWLEKCLHEVYLCPPEAHVTFTPVGVNCPIPGTNKVHISFSGLDEAEKFFMTRLMKVLGVNLLSNFSKRATHLFCPSAQGLKFDKAQEWGVPVVGMDWVEELKVTGIVPDVRLRAAIKKPEKVNDIKGKRKVSDDELQMANITNYVEFQTQEDSQPLNLDEPPLKSDLHPIPSLPEFNIAEKTGSFGKPNELLLPSRPPQKSPSMNGVNSSVTDPETKKPSVSTLMTSVPQIQKSHSNASSNDAAVTSASSSAVVLAPDSTPGQLGQGKMNDAQVPSSNTPSPVKAAPSLKQKGKARALSRSKSSSISPSKYYPSVQPIDKETSKALHDSLTSLLGKRRSEEGDGDRDGVRSRGDRIDGKRPRAMRSKSFLRSKDSETPQQVPEPDHVFDVYGGDGESFDVFGRESDVILGGDSYQEESIRVNYEDPEQRNEKKKLMKLIGKESQDEVLFLGASAKAASSRARMSTRERRTTRNSTGQRP